MDAALFHRLEGDNLCFRALEPEDDREVHEYASDSEVKRFIGWRLMKDLGETRDYIQEMIRRENEGTHLYASVVLKTTGKVIGTAMIFNLNSAARHAEIGYVFNKDYWGRGFGTEVVGLMNSFAFNTLKLHKLHARVVDTNLGSVRVLEKNGYVLEGRFKDYHFIDNRYYDELFFGRLE